MVTAAARRSAAFTDVVGEEEVSTRQRLIRVGCPAATVDARVAAGRWQRIGRAIVLHNGALTRPQRWRVGVLNCGPRAVLASFSALEFLGLTGWERDEVHVLAPAGVPAPSLPGLPVILHRTSRPIESTAAGQCQPADAALVLAAGSFRNPRSACGIIAAGVQQRLVTAGQLVRALDDAPRIRHRAVLVSAVQDIAMGAEALSEIDFVRLCRRHGLPRPSQQRIRPEPSGRRRYLDVEWTLPDGRRVVVEVDGALHTAVRRWWDDQLRQNEVTLSRALVLRFPSVVVRVEEALVVDQLRRALFARS